MSIYNVHSDLECTWNVSTEVHSMSWNSVQSMKKAISPPTRIDKEVSEAARPPRKYPLAGRVSRGSSMSREAMVTVRACEWMMD